ncbi:MAG: DUF1540 domain-containing protein [Tissierellia bacterium]|nr:DUF1540 domain-containing protein [Tissierellia bacterium]
MAEIKCTVTNCYFNKRVGCTAPTITVDGRNADESRKTSCDTFIEQKPGVRSSVNEPKSDTPITCMAIKCVYNDDERCEARDILVNGKNASTPEETLCSTFKS